MKQIYFLISAFALLFVTESCSSDNGEEMNPPIENHDLALVEKEIDGLKFSFWLSDMDGDTTNIFDEKDISERGFNFNMLLTNNSDQNIFIDNGDIGPYLSYVFDVDSICIGSTCDTYVAIQIIDKIKPGETYFNSRRWCGSDVNSPNIKLLLAGKYYTYFGESIVYQSGDNFDILDETKSNTTRKTVEVPKMVINFEVK